MTPNDDVLKSLAKSFMPQPEMLEVARKKSDLYIGIPKETSFQEKRVALTPSAVALLVNRGHEVVIETQAGKGANFEDHDYSEAGARITYSPEEVYKANIILKVEPPSHTEIEMMQMGQTLISALQLPIQPKNFLKKLIEKKITAIAFDYIMDEEKTFPVIRSMSEIAGTTSILIAAEYLSNVNSGQGLMLGGISGVPPIEVVILGAGTVGEYATRAAIGLGASVKVFDNNIYKLRRLQNVVNQRVYTSVVSPNVLKKALQTADVAIGAIRAPQGRTPCIVTEDMVKDMKNGAIVVDVSIDQGGCFETSEVTSHEKPTFKKYGVIHYGVPNIASRVAKTASSALSHVFSPMLLDIADDGGVEECLKKDFGIRQGIYLFKGILTNKYLGETFNLPYKDIDLLIAAYK
ncbi:MAG: alanine dehydrogenase [Flavobacteriales bacterium]|nr:alanine dehydrogenase [Flavobacteriales bacterium]